MTIRTLAAMMAVATACSACAIFVRPQAAPPPAPSFGYGVSGDTKTGVVQAFSMAGSTYVQFMDLDRARPYFVDEAGKPVEYKVSGQYAVITGEVVAVTVNTNFGRNVVYLLGSRWDPALNQASASLAPLPTPALTTAGAASAAQPAVVPPAAAAAIRPHPEMMTTTITFGNDRWELSSLAASQAKDLRAAIEVMRPYANHQVRIVGYADALGSPLYNLRLSERRADELAKAYREAGFKSVVAFGRGPRDQVSDCSKVQGKVLIDRCLAASRRVVIDVLL